MACIGMACRVACMLMMPLVVDVGDYERIIATVIKYVQLYIIIVCSRFKL